jgi:hypothetical protein
MEGTIIKLPDGSYGFENISHYTDRPEQIRMVWQVRLTQARGNLAYARVEDALGKTAKTTGGGGRLSVYIGYGAYLEGVFGNGTETNPGDVKAISVETTAVPKPKVRPGVELRWRHDGYRGYWQKYLKTKGWVTA